MIVRSVAFPALLVLFTLTDSMIAQPATLSWSDAVGQIAGERARAETCVRTREEVWRQRAEGAWRNQLHQREDGF